LFPVLELIMIAAANASAAQPAGERAGRSLPEGPGLAAKYPGDAGLADDAAVVFAENFEQDSLQAVQKRWESVSAAERMELTDDTPAASAGKRSLRMTHVGGGGEGGHLYRRLLPGYDQLYVRFYVKFDPECAPVHHFFHVGGYHPPTPYPQGGAGQRPRGDERFTVGIEPHGSAWVWDYYAYWMRMRGSPPRGQTWGNSFVRDPEHKVARDEWICMETMIKLNDPDESNGELALWIDGRRVSHLGPGFPRGKWVYDKFLPGEGGDGVRWNDQRRGPEYTTVPAGGEPFEGFRWRSDERLKINFLWVLFYMTRVPEGHVSRVSFDDIVVATEYIGPLAAAEQAEREEPERGESKGDNAAAAETGNSAVDEAGREERAGRGTAVEQPAVAEPAGKTLPTCRTLRQ
jgi:hypothetical protein